MSETTDRPGRVADSPVELDVQPQPAEGVAVSLRCHPGAVRTENQDRVNTAATPLGRLVVVADGVGGGAGGAQAAQLAVTEYERFLQSTERGADPAQSLIEGTRAVNAKIEERRAQEPSLKAMSSTVALVLIRANDAYLGHLGDSRVYLSRRGEFRCLTRDHSVVRKMIDRGILTEEEAEKHPSAHILSHSLGQAGVDIEVTSLRLEPGDTLLLCSDGLWAYVAEDELAAKMTAPGTDPSVAADALLELALKAGAPDNVSVGVVRVEALRAPAQLHPREAKKSRLGLWWLWLALLGVVVTGMLVWYRLRNREAAPPQMAPIVTRPNAVPESPAATVKPR